MKRTARQQAFYIVERRGGQAGSRGVQCQVCAAGLQERPGHVPDQLFHEAEQLIQVLAEGELCLHHPEFGEVAAGATPLRSEGGVEGVQLGRTESLLCYLGGREGGGRWQGIDYYETFKDLGKKHHVWKECI